MRLGLLHRLLAGRCSIDQAIILSSTPRAGSTWLGQILSAIPHSASLFEPCHVEYVPEATAAGMTRRTYFPPDADWPAGMDFFTRVFDGHMFNWWTAQETTLRSALSARFLVVKFVRISRLLPWLCRHFSTRPPILLVRHPCAVVASQMKSDRDWVNPPRPTVPAYLENFPETHEVIARLETREEFLAATWALDYLPGLMAPQPRPWHLVSYEELVQDTRVTIDRLFAALDMKVPPGVWGKVNKPSSMTWKTGMSGLGGWRKQLDATQVRRILDITHKLGVTFYTDDLEPNYTVLHGPAPTRYVEASESPIVRSAPTSQPATQDPIVPERKVVLA